MFGCYPKESSEEFYEIVRGFTTEGTEITERIRGNLLARGSVSSVLSVVNRTEGYQHGEHGIVESGASLAKEVPISGRRI